MPEASYQPLAWAHAKAISRKLKLCIHTFKINLQDFSLGSALAFMRCMLQVYCA